MPRALKIIAWLAAACVLVAALGILVIELRWRRTYAAPYPDIKASADPAVIARGQYLVYGPGHCASCHTPNAEARRVAAGERLPLRGGHEFGLPFGRIYSANLTPDPETGIGAITDAAIARALRHGVRRDGRVLLPFMEFHEVSDDDLAAILSFLRTQAPVRHAVPDHQLNLLGRALMAFWITPVGPASQPPRSSPAAEPTVERGSYLANGVAGCVGCHTQRSERDGSFIGPRFGGGFRMTADDQSHRVFVTPNLTSDPTTGYLARWTEDAFVMRFRLGLLAPGSPMPWSAYRNLTENDVRAIFRYLRSLPPVAHDVSAAP